VGNFNGAVEGSVIDTERGSVGFGYDSLFVPAGHTQTFAELPPATKKRVEPPARALAAAREFLIKIVDASHVAPA
jgi:XTP/dITP diphosphohydrolase